MIDNIISNFGDKESTKNRLMYNDNLRKLCVEFCSTFKDVRVMASSGSNAAQLQLVMDNGLHAGLLTVSRDTDGDFYAYSSSIFVNKQKATARANKETRDSKTITGLIKAVTKNKEWPMYAKLYKSYERGLNYAFNATRNRTDARVDVGTDVLNALIINHVERNGVGIHDATIVAKYDELMLKRQQCAESDKTFKRFANGCKLVGINAHTTSQCAYYVGNVSAELNKAGDTVEEIKLIHLRRYDYLAECDEVAADMAIAKTYMQGKYPNENWNPLHIPFSDKYYPDIDIATGYENRHMLWVLIPHEA